MDSTPSPSSSSPFDLVSSALGRYVPRGGAAAAAGPANEQGDRTTRQRVPDSPAADRRDQILVPHENRDMTYMILGHNATSGR